MKTYPSILNLRPRIEGSQQIAPAAFSSDTAALLQDCQWTGYEKLDGTSVRIFRDGVNLVMRGRRDQSQLPPQLIHWFERNVDRIPIVPYGWCMYGEGIGLGIQNGGGYGEAQVVAFDMLTHTGRWLTRDELSDWSMGVGFIGTAPLRVMGSLLDCEKYAAELDTKPSLKGRGEGEGIICRPLAEPLDNHGERIIVKIKWRDYLVK